MDSTTHAQPESGAPPRGAGRRWLRDGTLTQKASLNALTSTLEHVAMVVVGLVINPLLVAGLGSYAFGLWQVLRQMTGYLSPATGRPTQALKWTVSSKQASTDYEDKRRDVGSAVLVWLTFLPLLGTLGGLMVWLAPSWLDAPPEMRPTVHLAAGFAVATLVMASLVHIPRAILQGENLGYKRMGLSAVLVLVGGGLTALALHLDLGLAGVAASPLVTSCLTGIMFLLVVRRNVPWFGIARPARRAARRFLGLSVWFLAWRAIMQVMRASDMVLLGILVSVESVTTYSLTKHIPQTIIGLVSVMVTASTPGLGGIIGARRFRKAIEVRSELMALTWLTLVVVGTTVLLWNQSFVGLWVGSEHYAGVVPTLAIILMVSQFTLIRNDAAVIDLTLDLRNKVLLGALAALLSLGAAAFAVKQLGLGIAGLCLGFMAGRTVLSLAYPFMVGRILGVRARTQLVSLGRPALVGALLLSAAYGLSEVWLAASWLSLIAGIGATVVLVLPLAFYAGITPSLRPRFTGRLQSLLRRGGE
jgi:O-antigen/teichoic acid export membrane protein